MCSASARWQGCRGRPITGISIDAVLKPSPKFFEHSSPPSICASVSNSPLSRAARHCAIWTFHDAILTPPLELPKSEDHFPIVLDLLDEDVPLAEFECPPLFPLLRSPIMRSAWWSTLCRSAIESTGPAHDRQSRKRRNAFRSNLHDALPRRLKSRALWRVIEAFAPVPA